MQNPFKVLTKEEIAKQEKENKDIAEQTKIISESAQHILSSNDGIKYKKDLEESTKRIIKLMMVNTESDPVKYAFFCKACLNKLEVCYELIERVEIDV